MASIEALQLSPHKFPGGCLRTSVYSGEEESELVSGQLDFHVNELEIVFYNKDFNMVPRKDPNAPEKPLASTLCELGNPNFLIVLSAVVPETRGSSRTKT